LLSSRDLGCAETTEGRPRQVCEAIGASLTWQWLGHATIAPGYTPSAEGIVAVYCNLNIGKDDLPALEPLRRYDPVRRLLPDWRLEAGAEMLSRLVQNRDGKGGDPETSIFHPKNPGYVLKNGCPGSPTPAPPPSPK
jgi:hypothetical protein